MHIVSEYLTVPGHLQIFSNGMYKSTEHRVTINSFKERISIGMFFNPKLDGEIGPADCLINEDNPPVFKTVPMEKYMEAFFSRKLQRKTFLDQMRIAVEQPKTEGNYNV